MPIMPMMRLTLKTITIDAADAYFSQFKYSSEITHQPAPPWLLNLLEPGLQRWLREEAIQPTYSRIYDALNDYFYVKIFAMVQHKQATYYYLRWGNQHAH